MSELNHRGERISELLPFEGRMRLVAASRLHLPLTLKAAAIDEATAYCRAFYPTRFQPLKEVNETQIK